MTDEALHESAGAEPPAASGASAERDCLGYRACLGVLVPATNTVVQPEYEALRPRGVTNHVARMQPANRPIDDMEGYRLSLERGTAHVEEAIDRVLHCEPDAILLGHSIDTFRGGVAGAKLQRDELSQFAGKAVFLPALAFLDALQALGRPTRLAILTPYFPPANEQVATFFIDAGYEVAKIIGLNCPGPLSIARTPRSRICEALTELARTNAELIVQPGTNLPTASLENQAMSWLGIPMLSCNPTTYWAALRGIGIDDRLDGFGNLFAQH